MIHSNTAWPLLLLAARPDMAALITASILTPSDAYTGEMLCRTELQIGWYLIIGALIWLCGILHWSTDEFVLWDDTFRCSIANSTKPNANVEGKTQGHFSSECLSW